MIEMILPDGSVRKLEKPMTVVEFAKTIGSSLGKATVGAVIDGVQVDPSYLIEKPGTIEIITATSEKGLEITRHSAAHIMAQAVQRLFPGTKVTIGPVIENGFFYDFDPEKPFTEEDFKAKKQQDLVDILSDEAFASFKRKADKLQQIAYPVIKQVYEQQGNQFERILIPITDGKRTYNIPVGLKEAYETEGKEVVLAFEKAILLHNIDEAWKENLRELDDLRQSVQNASYEQKDPLLIYKLESFNLFKAMIETINSKVTAILMRGQIPIREPEQVRRAEAQRRSDYSRYRAQKDEYSAGSRQQNPNDPTRQDTREQQITQPIRVEKTVGRNDPCPCGSGKKYKFCCGKN